MLFCPMVLSPMIYYTRDHSKLMANTSNSICAMPEFVQIHGFTYAIVTETNALEKIIKIKSSWQRCYSPSAVIYIT